MRILMTLLFVLTITGAQAAPVHEWATNVIQSHDQPQWKKKLAEKAITGKVSKFLAKTTRYSDKNYLDPGTGGGPDGCTWINPNGRKLDSVRLKPGYVAADLKHYPTGTVMYAGAPFNRSWIVVDCGPGVRGRRHIDVYHADWSDWNWYAANVSGPVNVWVLGRITRAQAIGKG